MRSGTSSSNRREFGSGATFRHFESDMPGIEYRAKRKDPRFTKGFSNERSRSVSQHNSRRTRGMKSSGRTGKSSISAGILRYRVRISRVHLSLSRFHFVFPLQNCLKSYGGGDENSYKKRNRLISQVLNRRFFSRCFVIFEYANLFFRRYKMLPRKTRESFQKTVLCG